MKSSKKIGLVVGIILFTLLMAGATMAYWVWRGNVAEVNTTLNIPFNCAADGGVHASTVALAPADCNHSRFAIKREITIDYDLFSPNSVIYMDMILTVKNIGQGLSASTNFKYALTTSDNSCTNNVITSGTFTNKSNGSTIKLLDNQLYHQVGMDVVNTYYLYIWIDAVEENPNVLNQNFEFTLSLECSQGSVPGAVMLINKANDESVTSYTSGNAAEMYTFSQPETEQLAATTDYRYIGNNPNNYITFNNETWRIIGVFDGKIKIVRNQSVGGMPRDYKLKNVGSSNMDNGSNDWIDSQLMYMLNPDDISRNVLLKNGYSFDGTYVKDTNGKIIYQKGCNPAQTDGTSYSCTTNTWSLNSTALSQVIDVTYYLGSSLSTNNTISVLDFYAHERSMNKYDAVRSINWVGKVGLIYPSDYGFQFAYGINDECYNDLANCTFASPSNAWLYLSNYRWTISSLSSGGQYGIMIYSDGKNKGYASFFGAHVYPVVYLKPNISLSGTGTSGDPYIIVS